MKSAAAARAHVIMRVLDINFPIIVDNPDKWQPDGASRTDFYPHRTRCQNEHFSCCPLAKFARQDGVECPFCMAGVLAGATAPEWELQHAVDRRSPDDERLGDS